MSDSGFSTSVRFEKLSKTEAAAKQAHEARTAENPGVGHANDKIVPDLTMHNKTWVNNGNGQVTRTTDPSDWGRYVSKALDERVHGDPRKHRDGTPVLDDAGNPVYKAIRKDAKHVVDAVFQLDPKYTGTSEELLKPENAGKKARVEMLLVEMAKVHSDKMGGIENVVGFSIQWDETHPHMHMQSMPITPDGRLSAKTMLPSHPKAMSKYHDEFRAALREHGYDATFERVDGGRSHDPQFKRTRDREDALDRRDSELTAAEQSAAQREQAAEQARLSALAAQQQAAEATARAEEAARAAQDAREKADEERRQAQEARRQAEEDRRQAAEERRQAQEAHQKALEGSQRVSAAVVTVDGLTELAGRLEGQLELYSSKLKNLDRPTTAVRQARRVSEQVHEQATAVSDVAQSTSADKGPSIA